MKALQSFEGTITPAASASEALTVDFAPPITKIRSITDFIAK